MTVAFPPIFAHPGANLQLFVECLVQKWPATKLLLPFLRTLSLTCDHFLPPHHSLLSALSQKSLWHPQRTPQTFCSPVGHLDFSSNGGCCELGVGSIRKWKGEEVVTSWLECVWYKLPGTRENPRQPTDSLFFFFFKWYRFKDVQRSIALLRGHFNFSLNSKKSGNSNILKVNCLQKYLSSKSSKYPAKNVLPMSDLCSRASGNLLQLCG